MYTDGITLQVNLATTDVSYAKHTVPALARAHRASVREVVVTIDCCKPKKTRLFDPAARCPEPWFTEQLDALKDMADSLVKDGLVDRVVCLRPDDPWLEQITRKYSGPWLPETHDYGGRPVTGFWAAIEVADTRYVLHYDGDMFVYQEPGFDWAVYAIPLLARQANAFSASPRTTPPYASRIPFGDYVCAHEGMPLFPVEGGWKQYFFSTRAFLLDREKLDRYLPLGRGRMLLEEMAVKVLRRGFPRSAEKKVWVTTGRAGGYRLILSTEKAWVLHPNWKPPSFAALAPAIADCIARNRFPDAQLGKAEIELDAWEAFIRESASQASA